jgi:hypothetical protein
MPYATLQVQTPEGAAHEDARNEARGVLVQTLGPIDATEVRVWRANPIQTANGQTSWTVAIEGPRRLLRKASQGA